MTHIARQRIKAGGRFYRPGDPVDLGEEDLADLPKGAVALAGKSGGDSEPAPSDPDAPKPTLQEWLSALEDYAFRKDGELRSATRRDLVDALGEDPGDEAIAAALVSIQKDASA